MSKTFLLDFTWPPGGSPLPEPAQAGPGVVFRLWRSIDGLRGRAYCEASGTPGAAWELLKVLRSIDGPDHGEPPGWHYVVEADVAAEHDADFNAWYEQEHLPGLARVPGTIRASRYERLSGTPRYLACYDLKSPSALERPEWLAVRHTEWSSRIRPLFRNTRRTMFISAQRIE
jgi:hypothetical protein